MAHTAAVGHIPALIRHVDEVIDMTVVELLRTDVRAETPVVGGLEGAVNGRVVGHRRRRIIGIMVALIVIGVFALVLGRDGLVERLTTRLVAHLPPVTGGGGTVVCQQVATEMMALLPFLIGHLTADAFAGGVVEDTAKEGEPSQQERHLHHRITEGIVVLVEIVHAVDDAACG